MLIPLVSLSPETDNNLSVSSSLGPFVSFFAWFILLHCSQHAESVFERQPLVPEITANGGASVGLADRPSAFLWNPAAGTSTRSAFVTAYSKPFGIDELTEGFLGYNHKITDVGTLGLGWQRLSTTGYRENRQSIAFSTGNGYGRLGVRFDRFDVGIDGFGRRSAIGLNVGGLLKLSTLLQIGVAVGPVNRPEIPQPLPRRFDMGVGLNVLPKLLLVADLTKRADAPIQVRMGSELRGGRHLVLRAGMHNEPWEVTLGWGLRFASLAVDYAWVNHSSLASSHQIGVTWHFGGS